MTRYRWIAHQEAEGVPVAAPCRVARVSRQAYYAWRRWRERGPDQEHLVLASELRAIWEASDGTYGSPRVTHELRRSGYCVNHKRVERLMRELEMAACPPRRFVRTTRREEEAPLPDLVSQNFAPGEPKRRYVSDITDVRSDEGFCYLATVADLGSRRIVGWSLGRRMPDDLVVEAICGALGTRGSLAGAIFHSDRGSQYLSRKVRQLCATLGLRQSVGRVATCYDNAVAEAFFGSLKRELVGRYRFANLAEARSAIATWIQRYNTVRLHSSLGYLPPVEYELSWACREVAVA
ncbi:Integrase catalytic region [Acidimicrobium ferrooxidans DSM 10331]|uniref:Integrase catalytic region n=1 Tax=Acidimicrobium ferrooxidans (strain DSM 10331 / JCM 15462 / NBRC 103882 / ICP) TaxID=525909 RepID=C7LY31_ACIFD|nr:Integrase catalytic region [Acidimicrobium ferrooxidans DSM 10331]